MPSGDIIPPNLAGISRNSSSICLPIEENTKISALLYAAKKIRKISHNRTWCFKQHWRILKSV